MIALLDVNVLMHMLNPQHVHHDSVHHCFAQHFSAGWTTSPLTNKSVLRILGHPRYPNSPSISAELMLFRGLRRPLFVVIRWWPMARSQTFTYWPLMGIIKGCR